MIDFKLNNGFLSEKCKEKGLFSFSEVSNFVKNLPYKRNSDKENLLCILEDLGGTCSTKHALLKRLCDENGVKVQLILGIFKMNAKNTSKIASVLEKYMIDEVPEAHNYLKYNDVVLDYTEKKWDFEFIREDIIEEIEINPEQITDFKVKYHQDFLKKYLAEHTENQYTLNDFWRIREECILVLQS